MMCVPYTLNSMTPIIEIVRCCVSKILKMTSTDLCNQCFKTCLWIPLTMVKSLLLNSALREIKIPAQLSIFHIQVQYWLKFGIHLQFAESTYICGFHLQLVNQLATIACCGIRNKTNVPTKLTLQVYVCGIHLQLVNQLAIIACCGIRNKTNVPTKLTLQVYVCGIHWNFVCGIHLHFGTYSKNCLWNPGTNRHKIVLLSSAQFGLVMIYEIFL